MCRECREYKRREGWEAMNVSIVSGGMRGHECVDSFRRDEWTNSNLWALNPQPFTTNTNLEARWPFQARCPRGAVLQTIDRVKTLKNRGTHQQLLIPN
jgi:hypothetical protein